MAMVEMILRYSILAKVQTMLQSLLVIALRVYKLEQQFKKIIKGLLVNTKNANTFTGKQGKESIDIVAKNL